MSQPRARPLPASYSTAELARRLGVSTPTVQRWVDLGYLKAWKTVGGHRRIDADGAERFLTEQGLALAEAPAAKPAKRGGGPSVLIVDDNPDDRDILSDLVQSVLPASKVATAENGFQALVAIGQSAPDILVTDIVMPHMNGVEMLRHLALNSEPRPMVLVAVSSLSSKQVAKLGTLPRGVKLLQKPVDPTAFAKTIAGAVRESK